MLAAALAIVTVPVIAATSSVGGSIVEAAPGDASERFFGAAGDEVGTSVDRDGDVHVIGGNGVAYVTRRSGTEWLDTVELLVPGGNPRSFGSDVAIDLADDGQFGVAVVGAETDPVAGARSGSAHVFEFTPAGGWVHVQSVVGVQTDDRLGSGVDVQLLDDDRTANIVVGAQRTTGVGFVLSWIRRAGVATTPDVLTTSRIDGNGRLFGTEVVLEGDLLVVGAVRGDPLGTGLLPGSAHIFEADVAGALAGADTMAWIETTELSQCGVAVLPDPMPFCGTSSGEGFGWSIDVDLLGPPVEFVYEGTLTDVIVVGAPWRSGPGGGDAGSVGVFHRERGGDWEQVQQLFHDDAGGTDRLGWRVAVDGRMLAASTLLRNDEDAGVFVFGFDGVRWNEVSEGVVSGDGPGVRLGTGLAVEGRSISAGAPFDELVAAAQGSVTEYVESIPPADFPPIARDDAYTTWEGDDTLYLVWENDEDPELGQEVSINDIPVAASNGTATIEQGGYSIGYEPNPGFVGTDTFTYEISDGGLTATAEVTMTVIPALSLADATVGEDAGIVEIGVTASAPITDGATFEVAATGVTADGDDYTLGLTDYAIEPGGDAAVVSVTIVDDDDAEPTERFEVSIVGATGVGGVGASATVTITDDDTDGGGGGGGGGGGDGGVGEIGPPWEPPVDDGPTGGETGEGLEAIFDWIRSSYEELTGLIPDRDEFSDFVFANWPPQLPDFPSLGWPDICAWLEENFDTERCDIFGFDRDDPSAVLDTMTIQQGTTGTKNVAANDFDPAGRVIFTKAASLPSEEQALTGLTSVEIDAFGHAVVTAEADYEGRTSFSYETCTAAGHCATGVVLVTVTVDPPPPIAQPDRINIRLGERRPGRPGVDDPVRSGINLLGNDQGAGLRLTKLNEPTQEGYVADLGTLVIEPGADGSVRVESERQDPPIPGQSDLRVVTVPYEVCDELEQCATSSLTIAKTGVGPQLADDPITVGRRQEVQVPVLGNDESGVELVEILTGPDDGANLDSEHPPRIEGDRIILTFAPHPSTGFRVSYRACRVGSAPDSLTDCGLADIVVTELVDRVGATANDDTFTLGRLAHAGVYPLDVIGPEGGGPDHSDHPIGFRVPAWDGQLDISWVDDRGTDDESDDVLHPFAYVMSLDPFTTSSDLVVGPDGTTPFRGLALFPLVVGEGDERSIAPPPPAGAFAEFEYEICDADLDTFEERIAQGLTPELNLQLCDTAKVRLDFVEEPPLAVEGRSADVGLIPDGQNGLVLPATPIPIPGIRGEQRYFFSTAGIEIVGGVSVGAEIIDTPAEDPFTGRVIDAERVGTREVAGDLIQPGNGEVLFDGEFGPIPPGADLYYTTTLTDGLLSGEAVSKVNFVPVDFHTAPTPVQYDLGVDGFDIEVPLTDQWFVTPRGDLAVDWAPRVELRSVEGVAAEPGADIYHPAGDYRLEILAGPETGLLDTIRLIPRIGFDGPIAARYEACATWTAERAGSAVTNPVFDAPYEICRPSFVLFEVDATVGDARQFAPPGGALAFPFDDSIDPWLEFTIEDDLGAVFEPGADHGDASIGTDALAAVADLFDAAGVDFDATFSGSATVRLTAGVDSIGPYVDGATTFTVEAVGAGSIDVTQTLGGLAASVSGIASADGTFSVQLGPAGTRYHLADLTDLSSLAPIVDYDLIVGASAELDAGIVTATPYAAARVQAPDGGGEPDVVTTVVVPVRVEIPGSDDGSGEPVVLEFEGRQEGAGLRVVGSGEVPVGSLLDGFGVSDISVNLFVDDAGTNGTITANIDVPALADSVTGAPSVVPVRMDIVGSVVTGTATASVDGLAVGPQDAPFLTVNEGDVTAIVSGDTTTGDLDLAVSIAATGVELLPGNPLGSASMASIAGDLTSEGSATLSFTDLTAGTADYTAIAVGSGELTLGADADTPVLVLTNVTAFDSGDVSVVVGQISFFADGDVRISDGCLASDVGLAETFGFADILPFDVTSACLDDGIVTVEGFFDFSLMEDFPFTPTITIGTQTVDADSDTTLDENRFTFSMDAATLRPLDVGPIRLGINDLDIGGLTADGYIEIAGYRTEIVADLQPLQGNHIFDGSFTGEFDVDVNGAVGELPLGADADIGVIGQIYVDDNGSGVLELAIDAEVRGFIGEYVELTEGAVRMLMDLTVPYDPTDPNADPVDALVRLESAALAGVVRIPGLESGDDSGGIPVSLTFDGSDLTVTAGGGEDYAAGPIVFGGTVGTLTLSDLGGDPSLVGSIIVADLSGSIADVVTFQAGTELSFDTDPETPLLSLTDVQAFILDPAIVGDEVDNVLAELAIESVEISDDGGLTVGVIEATRLDLLADRFGFGQLLPFTITGLRIDPTDPNAITTTVAGTFDFSQLESALPGDVEITATLGDGADGCDDLGITGADTNTFCFTLALDALGQGAVSVVEFGPLALELSGLDVGGVVGSANFEIAGYSEGGFDGTFSGDVDVATDLGGALSGEFAASITGDLDAAPDGSASLTMSGTVDASLVIDDSSGSVNATFQLGIDRSAAGIFIVTGPVIDELDLAACLELSGFSSGPDCDGVFAQITKDGPIWTAVVGGAGGDGGGDGVDVTVAGGAISVDGLTGTLTVDTTEPNAPAVTGSLAFDGATALLGGVVEFEISATSFSFDADPATPLLDPTTVTGRLYDGSGTTDDDVLVTIVARDVTIASDGTLGVSEIRATDLDQAAAALGVADLLPFVISGLSVTFDGDDLTAPEAVTVRTAGSFDLSAIEHLGPRVQIGDGNDNGNCDGLGVGDDIPDVGGTFCFGVRIDSSGVRPVGLGPILLALDSVEIGPLTFSGSLELGGFDDDGVWTPIPGSSSDVRGVLRAAVEIEDDDGQLASAEVELDVSGDFSTDAEGRILLGLSGSAAGGFTVRDIIELQGATVGFGVTLRLDTRDGVSLELLEGDEAPVHSLSADLVRVSVPDVFTVEATQISVPIEEGVLFRVAAFDDGGKVGLTFGDPDAPADSSNPLDGWGGDIGGFEVGFDGAIRLLEGFGVQLRAGDAGFPEYLPIVIDELGFVVGGDSLTDRIAAAPDGALAFDSVINDLRLRGSMSIDGPDALPVQGSVDGLEIDITKLRRWFSALAAGETPAKDDFFITNLDALFFGVDQLEIGPVVVSGGLGIGVVPTDSGPKFWARILGGFVFQGYGLGIDVLISEYGPLSVDVTVPGAMVLGQTGIVVAVTEAGASFNSAPPSICTTVVDGVFACDDGSPSPEAVAEFQPSAGLATDSDIADAIQLLAASPVPLLPDSFGVFVKGQISHLAIAAFVQGTVELAMYFGPPPPPVGDQTPELPGVKLVGKGAVEFWGMSLGDLVLYADYADPLAPAWSVASSVANGGDLLDLFFPVGASQALTVDTDGLAAASILGVRELVIGLIDGGLNSPAMEELFADPLDALIIRMRTDPNSRLRQVLFGEVPNDAVTLDALRTRLLDVLPGPAAVDGSGKSEIALLLENAAADGEAALEQLALAVDVAGALFADLMSAVIDGETVVDPNGNVTRLSPEEQAAKGQQVIDAFQEFLSNAPDLARQVGQVVYEVANPAVIAQAKIQFELLDVPVGEPALDATLVINKEGFFASFDASLAKLTAAAATFVNAGGAILIPLSLALNDQSSFSFAFPGRIDELLEGADGSVFDPRQGSWAAGLGSDIYFLGMQVSETDGLIVPGDSADQVEAWEIATGKTIPDRRGGSDTGSLVRDALVADGGLYSTGTLRVPEMLADPIGWAADVGDAFDDVVDAVGDDWLKLPGLIEAASTDFFATRPGGQYELFTTAPTYDPDAGPPTDRDAWTWSADPYVDAGLGVDLLGYRVANGSMTMTENGVITSVEFPFLDGPLQTRIESVVLQGQEAAAAAVEAGEAELSSLVRWPTIEIDQTITVADVRTLLASLEMDDPIPDTVSDTSSLRIRGYSPNQHLAAADPEQVATDDPIRASGGFEIIAGLDSDGFFAGGFRIAFGLGTGGSLLPSFAEFELTTDPLDLGGVVLTDGRLLGTYDAEADPTFDLFVEGDVRIDAFDQTIRFAGSLSRGFLTTAFSEPIKIGPLTITEPIEAGESRLTGPDVTLRRTPDGMQLELDGEVRIEDWTGSAVIDTVLDNSGQAQIDVTLDGFGRSGIVLDGVVTISLELATASRPASFELDLDDGLLTVASIGLDDVAIEGLITDQGIESLAVRDISFDLAPGVRLECADIDFSLGRRWFELSGSAGLTVAGLREHELPTVPGGPGSPFPGPFVNAAPTPGGCEHDGFGVSIDLSSDGSGRVELLGSPSVQLAGVGATLADAAVTRSSNGAVRFATRGAIAVLGASMDIAVATSLEIDAEGFSGDITLGGSIPDLLGWELRGTLRLSLDSRTGVDRFELSGSVAPPFVSGSLSVGTGTWIDTGPNPDFDIRLSADELTFGGSSGADALRVSGDLAVRRIGNALGLSITNASFDVPGFTSVSADLVEVSSTGVVDVDDLVIGRIGTDDLRISGLRVDLTRSSDGQVQFRLHGGVLTGSVLNGREIAVTPTNGTTIEFGTTTGIRRNFTMPGLELGSAFTWPSIPVRLEASATRVELRQRFTRTATLFGADVELSDVLFRWSAPTSSAPSGTITVDGSVDTGGGPGDGFDVVGRRLRGTFALENAGPALRLALKDPISIALTPLPLVTVDGWVQSDGQLELSGAWSTSDATSFPVPQSVSGEVTFAIGPDGPSVTFEGSATGFVTGSARGSFGKVTDDGENVLAVTVYKRANFTEPLRTFFLPPGVPYTPTISVPPPEFGSIPQDGVTVWVAADAPDEVRAYFLEQASLTVAGADESDVSCFPEDGAFLEVGQTTPVVCSVSDGDRHATAAFDVTVSRMLGTQQAIVLSVGSSQQPAESGDDGKIAVGSGAPVRLTGRADPGTSGTVSIRSERVELGTFIAGADGQWELVVEVPASLELGDHTIVVDSVLNGARRLDHLQVVVQQAVPDPVGGLPATGRGLLALRWAVVLVALGLIVLLASRRRRSNCAT